jgi:hypothetical protein
VHFLDDAADDDFSRLHRLFVFHLGVAVALAWMTAAYAACYTPWVHNIRPLLDGVAGGRVESTWSYLFGMPTVLAVAWVVAFFGRDVMRRVQLVPNQLVEFGFAAAAGFALFYLSIDRAVAALLIGG